MFDGFQSATIATSGGASIFCRHAGRGPPLLLLHGNPQTHAIWHLIAPRLAERFHVIAADLRGYGDSTGPGDPNRPVYPTEDYTFRAMGQDMLEVMAAFGHQRFNICGHDRGGRTTHRLCLDQPDRMIKAAILDILPTRHVWENVNAAWAAKSWHWIFMPQEGGLPEAMIEGVPAAFYMERKIGKPGMGMGIFAPEALAEYLRCFTPKTIRASCADYRAAATLDLEMDRADAGRLSTVPTLVLWGAKSHTQAMFAAPLDIWRDYVADVRGQGIVSGHYMAEHAPEEVLGALLAFY